MISLSQFIIERQTGEVLTKEQELLSCVFFDAYINRGNKFKGPEDIVEYYNAIRYSTIDRIAALSHADVAKFDKIIQPEQGKRIIKYTDWSKSYVYQCEALEKWIKTHKSFDTVLTFVHHDTSIGICNDVLSINWNIGNRVDNGKNKYKISNKDDYQKADIYAVVQDPNTKPEDDIMDEVEYWVQSLEGKTSEKFVGISLKKIIKPLSNVHTYGLDNLEFKIGNDVTLDIPIFNGISFNGDLSTTTPGPTSSGIKFVVNDSQCTLNIRTSGADPSHYVGPHFKKEKPAIKCFSVSSTAQMVIKGMGGQAGRCQTTVDKWMGEYGIEGKPKKGKDADSSSFKMMIDKINNMAQSLDINFSPIVMSGDCIKLIDFVSHNYDSLRKMFDLYRKAGNKLTDEVVEIANGLNIMLDEKEFYYQFETMFSIIKWKTSSYQAISVFLAILHKMMDEGRDNILRQLYCAAKGISQSKDDIRLPYVMIG